MTTTFKRIWYDEDGVMHEQDIDPAEMYLSPLEAELEAMSDDEVVRFYQTLEVEDPRGDVVAGEMERRNVDL